MKEQRKPTIEELVNTVASLRVIKPTMEETYRFVDSKDARTEFDTFNNYVKKTVSIGLELFYSQVNQEVMDNFAQFYTKVTGKPFDQGKIVRPTRPLTIKEQRANELLNMLAQGGFNIYETISPNSTKSVNRIEAYLDGYNEDIVKIFPLWIKKNPSLTFSYHSICHLDRSITLNMASSWNPDRSDVELMKDNKKYYFMLHRSREEMRLEGRVFRFDAKKRVYIPRK